MAQWASRSKAGNILLTIQKLSAPNPKQVEFRVSQHNILPSTAATSHIQVTKAPLITFSDVTNNRAWEGLVMSGVMFQLFYSVFTCFIVTYTISTQMVAS